MLVDDEPRILSGLRRALRGERFEVVTATSGAEALSKMAIEPVDAVVSDHDMPGMTGTEFLTKVCETYPSTVRFILTGKATLDMAIKAVNEGQVHRFLNKPCNTVDLAVTIRQALQQKALMEEAKRLLAEVRRQRFVIDQVEKDNPGLTEVNRDQDGVIVMDNIQDDMESLLAEINSCMAE
jgi:response regulator RpfG family c-di-GMP phosphodiesterase